MKVKKYLVNEECLLTRARARDSPNHYGEEYEN